MNDYLLMVSVIVVLGIGLKIWEYYFYEEGDENGE